MARIRILVESPFAGRGPHKFQDEMANDVYVRALCRQLSLLGHAPLASHVFYTQFLNDKNPQEREAGIEAGLAWGVAAAWTVVGVDRGMSHGMKLGIQRALGEGRTIYYVSSLPHRGFDYPNGETIDELHHLVGARVPVMPGWVSP